MFRLWAEAYGESVTLCSLCEQPVSRSELELASSTSVLSGLSLVFHSASSPLLLPAHSSSFSLPSWESDGAEMEMPVVCIDVTIPIHPNNVTQQWSTSKATGYGEEQLSHSTILWGLPKCVGMCDPPNPKLDRFSRCIPWPMILKTTYVFPCLVLSTGCQPRPLLC